MTYEFACQNLECEYKFEEFYKILQREDPKPPCPKCGGKTKRMMSVPRVVFIDNPHSPDGETWSSKHVKWYGSHGDLGNAEKVRLASRKKKLGVQIEKEFYNDVSIRNKDRKFVVGEGKKKVILPHE